MCSIKLTLNNTLFWIFFQAKRLPDDEETIDMFEMLQGERKAREEAGEMEEEEEEESEEEAPAKRKGPGVYDGTIQEFVKIW